MTTKRKTYAEKLKDPRWQRRRLEILETAGFRCRDCGDKDSTLHVHHGYYRRGADPWDYPDKHLHCLCEACHKRAEEARDEIYRLLATLRPTFLEAQIPAIRGIREFSGVVSGYLREPRQAEAADE